MGALEKANAGLAAWHGEVEKLAQELYDCFEREKEAEEKGEPTQGSVKAYSFAFHQIGSLLRRVARHHNEAVNAIRIERGQ